MHATKMLQSQDTASSIHLVRALMLQQPLLSGSLQKSLPNGDVYGIDVLHL